MFFDTDYARRVFKPVVRQTLDCGVRSYSPFASHPID